MRKDRQTLEKLLYSVFIDCISKEDIIDKVVEGFKRHNILFGDVMKIINKNDVLENKPDILLYLFAKYFYLYSDEPRLNPQIWFTENEIKEGDKYKETKELQKKFPIVIENVIKLANDLYTTVVPIKNIANLYNSRVITYNFQTQRDPKIKRVKDKIFEVPNVNKKSVMEITKEIIDGTFIPNHITLNVLQNGEDIIKYDEINKRLIISNGDINIADGFHRSLAFNNVINQFPNIERSTGLNIGNFDVDKCRKYIRQEDKRNKISEEYINSLNTENLSNTVVKKINEKSTSELRGKVATDKIYITKSDAIIMFSDLQDGIEHFFEVRNSREANTLGDFLVEGLNEIIGIKFEEFQNKNSFFRTKEMFLSYLGLLALLKDVENWKKKLEKIMLRMNVEEIHLLFKKTNKKNMYDEILIYFKKLIEEGEVYEI